jgi:hypothetical protein
MINICEDNSKKKTHFTKMQVAQKDIERELSACCKLDLQLFEVMLGFSQGLK